MNEVQTLDDRSRPTWILAGIAVLEALSYLGTSYVSGQGGFVACWVLLSLFLVWRLWSGSYGAWLTLVILNVCVIALCGFAAAGVVGTGQSGAWLALRTVETVAELLILWLPRVRSYIN